MSAIRDILRAGILAVAAISILTTGRAAADADRIVFDLRVEDESVGTETITSNVTGDDHVLRSKYEMHADFLETDLTVRTVYAPSGEWSSYLKTGKITTQGETSTLRIHLERDGDAAHVTLSRNDQTFELDVDTPDGQPVMDWTHIQHWLPVCRTLGETGAFTSGADTTVAVTVPGMPQAAQMTLGTGILTGTGSNGDETADLLFVPIELSLNKMKMRVALVPETWDVVAVEVPSQNFLGLREGWSDLDDGTEPEEQPKKKRRRRR